ncbi:MAG: 1-deoxy-D-xylulose-5-phosphate reductoisomerase [Candidatus Omnitrophica bacterium]|nr:1-deoxy-D-xylulose-5-phosphate reductoisomerase [Candidatus Omnitrophota bacterium]
MKTVVMFGSTGSVGANALDVLGEHKKDFRVQGLCTCRNVGKLAQQVSRFKPQSVCVVDETKVTRLRGMIPNTVRIFSGRSGLLEFAAQNADIAFMAISGIACLEPLLVSLQFSRCVALANKESLVVAGKLVRRQAKLHNTLLLPVDSEINALFQLLKTVKKDEINRVHITASGGALYACTPAQLRKVKAKQVLAHPTWRMGRRITVDSATLVNKGFEVIETHEFFDIDYDRINIIVHRESLMHAAIELNDGTFFSCFYEPDMRIPIEYAFCYPRRNGKIRKKGIFNGKKVQNCTFGPVDFKKFPLLKLVLAAAKKGDNALTVLNASDEVAVDSFLKERIAFTDLYPILEYVYTHSPHRKISTLDEVIYWDTWARNKTKEYIEKKCC